MEPCKHPVNSRSQVTHDRQVSKTGAVSLIRRTDEVYLCLDCGKHIRIQGDKVKVVRLRGESR